MPEKYMYKINSSDIPVLYPYPLFNTFVLFNIVTYKWYLRHGNHNFLWTMSWHSYEDMLLYSFSLLGEDYSIYRLRSYISYIENMPNTHLIIFDAQNEIDWRFILLYDIWILLQV